MRAALPDERDRLRPAAELLHEAVERLRPAAHEVGCAAQLDSLVGLLDDGGGAGVQRAAHRDGGMPGLLELLVARACDAAAS